MWTKREAEWERERLARERLMAEVKKELLHRSPCSICLETNIHHFLLDNSLQLFKTVEHDYFFNIVRC